MIDAIIEAALKPFTTTVGWQAFAYGVTGKIITVYAWNFIRETNEQADKASESAEEQIEESTSDEE